MGKESSKMRDLEYRRVVITVAMALLNPRKNVVLVTKIHLNSPPDQIQWDTERFSDRLKTKHVNVDHDDDGGMDEELRRKFFPEPERRKLVDPTVIVDQHSNILVWFLPGVLFPETTVGLFSISVPHLFGKPFQESINAAVDLLSPMLKESLKVTGKKSTEGIKKKSKKLRKSPKEKSVPWRIHPKLFSDAQQLKGAINLSPGYFMQGQDVS